MRKKILFTIFLIVSLFSVDAYGYVAMEVGVFYDALAPYGDWIYLDTYGVWVWRPVGLWAGWQPYTYGRWEWSEEYGWIWVSYFEWGWAPFHYGRWFYDPYYGWVWVPGTIWRPHWVVWIYTGTYVGWYPYYPSFVYIDYYSPVVYERWVIVNASHLTSGDYHRHAVRQDKRAEIFGSTSGVHKYIPKEDDTSYHNYGPPKSEIERSTGRRIEPIKAEFVNKPVNFYNPQTRTAQIYKPEFSSKIGDVGQLRSFNKDTNPAPAANTQIKGTYHNEIPSPRYNYPLGGHMMKGSRGYHYNEYKGVFNVPDKKPEIYNIPSEHRQGNFYNEKPSIKGNNQESIKNLSAPPVHRGLNVPKSSSDDEDDSSLKKGIPKFSPPKGGTVPKSIPQIKDK